MAQTALLAASDINSAGGLLIRSLHGWGGYSAIGDSLANGRYAGSSLTDRISRRSKGKYLTSLTSDKFAVGGKRSDEILAQVPAAIASNRPVCLITAGTNDIEQSVAASTFQTNMIAIWNKLLLAGIMPLDIGLFPRNSSATLALARADHMIWRQYYCAKNGIPHVNIWPAPANSDGTYKANYYYDQMHPSPLGADATADLVAARMATPWQRDPILELIDRAVGGTVIMPNAVSFGGTGAALPTGYSASGSSGTPTYSIQAADSGDFGNWLRCTFAGAAASDTGWNATAQTLSSLGWAIGDRILFACRLRFSAGVKPTITLTGATWGASNAQNSPIYQDQGDGTNLTDWYIMHEATITAGTTAGLKVAAQSSGAGYFEVNRPLMFNLTRAGL